MASEPPAAQPGPSARIAVAFIVIGFVIGASTLFKIVPAIVGSFTSQHAIVAPGSTSLHLDAGKYVVFERTGTTSGGSGFTFTNNDALTIRPDQVAVTAPNGEPVPVTTLGDTSESITRGSRVFTGAVTFHASSGGDYLVKVTSEPREAIVARSIGDTFGSVAGWFLLAVLGALVVVIGVLLMIIGVVRRNRASTDASVPPWPPPDWPSAQKP